MVRVMTFYARIQFRGPAHSQHTHAEAPWWLALWHTRTDAPMAQYQILVQSFEGWYGDPLREMDR